MKKTTPLLSFLAIIGIIAATFYYMMPQEAQYNSDDLSQFSVKRAMQIVDKIAQKPHFVGSNNHNEVVTYLQKELTKLGLSPQLQEGFTMTEKGTLVYSKNILARIKGSEKGKALLLLSHYDSAPHSYSKGASDDASGVATILESVRALLHNKSKHKNDIIILFSDAEEIGLNGAALFVTKHNWAKQVGLVLNFEARGSSGPSYMLIETNQGNEKLIDAFAKAKVSYPVSNSLMYSIYKMLPNDTDLTVFREKGNIQGLNFAFIDSHYNYHTAQDAPENLNRNTLAHQGSYLVPLLNYCSNANLSNLNSVNDEVYFNVPFSFIHYPFSYIMPLLIATIILFLVVVVIGLGKRNLELSQIARGFVSTIVAIIVTALIGFFGWKALVTLYPHYNEILQGFTYNGHYYIYAFISIAIAICFLLFKNNLKNNPQMSHTVSAIIIWLIVNIGIALKLQGAAFLIIPVISSVIMLSIYVISGKTYVWLNTILSIPHLVLIIPFIQMFPIGLGLKIIAGSMVLTVLAFALMLPVFGSYTKKPIWSVLFLLTGIAFFIKAHQNAAFEINKGKPNSLLYVYNADENKAYWTTYDTELDSFTKNYLGNNPKAATILNKEKLYSKYGTEFTFLKEAPLKKLQQPTINFVTDSIVGAERYLKIIISPNRKVNRYDIFAAPRLDLKNLKANGVSSISIDSPMVNKNTSKVLSYYVVDNAPLELQFSVDSGEDFDMTLVESSFDLLNNPLFTLKPRDKAMIPKPFVLNDAVVIKQKLQHNVTVSEPEEKNIIAKRL